MACLSFVKCVNRLAVMSAATAKLWGTSPRNRSTPHPSNGSAARYAKMLPAFAPPLCVCSYQLTRPCPCNHTQECKTITEKIRDQTNQRVKLPGTTEFTYEIVRYSPSYRPSVTTVGTAIAIFHSAFGPSRYRDGTDLVEVVCQGRGDAGQDAAPPTDSGSSRSPNPQGQEDDDEEEEVPDCSGFFVLVLRKGGVIVSAAAVRVHGPTFAELPYVATRDGYRREGNCRRLMTAVEALLHGLGVGWAVMPAVEEIAGMWIRKFGFTAAGYVLVVVHGCVVLQPLSLSHRALHWVRHICSVTMD
jgi:hypothetical protein